MSGKAPGQARDDRPVCPRDHWKLGRDLPMDRVLTAEGGWACPGMRPGQSGECGFRLSVTAASPAATPELLAAMAGTGAFKVFADEDSELRLVCPSAETIGCLYMPTVGSSGESGNFTATLAELILAACAHTGLAAGKVHAEMAIATGGNSRRPRQRREPGHLLFCRRPWRLGVRRPSPRTARLDLRESDRIGTVPGAHRFGTERTAPVMSGLMTFRTILVNPGNGTGARACPLGWLRSLRGQCASAGVPCFCKQPGTVTGQRHGASPKGGEWDKWPGDLRLRQMPAALGEWPA